MKNSTLRNLLSIREKNKLFIIVFSLIAIYSNAQTSYVEIAVNWPQWSSENRAEIYDPNDALIATIDNGYTGGINNAYANTLSLNCIPDGTNYYIIMYDTFDDGWNGDASNITVTSSGTVVLTNSGASASTAGTRLNFNVSGGCNGNCSATVDSFPYTESFETGFGAWTQSTNDEFDWSRRTLGTPSANTGPNAASDGNFYLYTEASNNYSNNSIIESPCFELTDAISAQFSFYYHMYGANMGTLDVDISTNGGLSYPTNLWSQTGQVQTGSNAAWNLVNLNLATFIGQTVRIRFSGTTGNNFRSDMAIDNISLVAVTPPKPEINVTGNNITINSGDLTPIATDNTDFGAIDVVSGSKTHTFSINNSGALTLDLTGPAPYVTVSGPAAADFTVSAAPTTPINQGNATNFDILFDPTSNGVRTATISIANNDANENPYTFTIQGFGDVPLAEGPGGVKTNVQLWLKANDGAGTTDGQALSLWVDQAKDNDAYVNLPGQEPIYRDNANANVNYNAVVDFNNNFNTYPIDYTYADTNRQFLRGDSGFYTDDMYVVVIPNRPASSSSGFFDIFCGDADTTVQATDASGVGFGAYSVRFENEVLSYCHGTTPNDNPPIDQRGYGVAETYTTTIFDNVGIINGRHNANVPTNGYELLYNNVSVVNTEVGVPQFGTIDNSIYWIGRSEGYKSSLDGRVVEIITFSARNNENPDRNRIQSYLAIKYGITLGVNGVSQDYVASNNEVIWDVSANIGYNFDIAGIGRDDESDLTQKQSKSANHSSIVSMSLQNTELTNNLNNNTFDTDNEFLIWGHDGKDTNSSAASIKVDLGPAIITTVTDVMNRKWKINETVGNDIGTVEVSLFESDLAGLPPLVGNDAYVMLVADDPDFTTSLKTVFLDPSTFNGIATREGTYDFDGTKYFTFGVAHEQIESRHLGFDGVDNYTLIGNRIDLSGRFTASAWVKPEGSNALTSDKTIVAKNNGFEGYKFFLTNDNYVSFSVGNTSASRIQSNTPIPDNIWHHVSVIYDGTTASIFIDGILDTTKVMSSPTPNGSDFAIGAIYVDKADVRDHFKGDIDEIRVWDDALTLEQLRYVMNQELRRNTTFVNGAFVPNTITKNDIAVVNWSKLLAYYSMNSYIGTHLNDVSGNGNRGSLTDPATFTLEFQSSPIPYKSLNNGDWDATTTWVNGNEQYIPGSPSIVDPNQTVNWNIVETNHNISMTNSGLPNINQDNRTVLGLFIDSNKLTVTGNTATNEGNGLTVTHYLTLDGQLDLEGESQLIQTLGSDFDVTSSGTLQRDQQGTQDLYTYNYWGSPVGISNTTSNNNSYKFPDIYFDGTNPATPKNINIITTGYDGSNGSPIGIADYWIWKFSNLTSDDYSEWQHVKSTGNLLAGEGFTLKGVNDTGGVPSLEQNYIIEGKPHNGDINLNINAGNDYLIGNPYASALDAHQFILDNAPTIDGTGNTTGTLYFWEHWGGGSHILAEYQGGYATYNLSGGVPSASIGTSDPDVSTGGTPTKIPGRYIPVAQGFFVTGENTGTIKFNNGQRAFVRESTGSIFIRGKEDNTVSHAEGVAAKDPFTNFTDINNGDHRMKIRIGFNSVNGIHRQLLVTKDSHATPEIDWGFDGLSNETQIDDMYWMVNEEKLTIQGTNMINAQTILPIGIKTSSDGENSITLDKLENAPSGLSIYLYDRLKDRQYDLSRGDFTVELPAGEYLDRFYIRFSLYLLSDDSSNTNYEYDTDIDFYLANSNQVVVINNPSLEKLNTLELINMAGQSVFKFDKLKSIDYNEITIPALSTGNYTLTISTENGVLSKKVLVNK